MEEGKDYIIKTKFVVLIDIFSPYGVSIPRISAICDTKEIAEIIKNEFVKDDKLKGMRIYIEPIVIGEKTEII